MSQVKSAYEYERKRILAEALRESHVSREAAMHEAGTGPNAAHREELRFVAPEKRKAKMNPPPDLDSP